MRSTTVTSSGVGDEWTRIVQDEKPAKDYGLGAEMKTGVIVFNLGGPSSLDEVLPFLRTLLSDPDVMRIRSHFLRNVLAISVAALCHRQLRGHYRKIGGASPLRRITEEQAQALSDELRWAGWEVDVFVGMCAWHPFLSETLDAVERREVDRLVVLPMFPQYSATTTGMGFRALQHQLEQRRVLQQVDTRWISSWQSQTTYIAAFAELIGKELAQFPEPAKVQILFCAHGLREHFVRGGDPYLDQTRETVELLVDRLGRTNSYRLSFQGSTGPGQWLGPSTNDVIVEFGRQGVDAILIVPVSFVAEQIETLYEMDIQYRRVASDAGVRTFRRVPALNCDPTFIRSLRELVEAAADQ